MKLTTQLLFLFSAALCLFSCSNNATTNKEVAELNQPEFADNGKTVDSLKRVYKYESIEYENWTENDATDSCLTVSLVNSNFVGSSTTYSNKDGIDVSNELEGIARVIKKSLAQPEKYKSFYIIFVEKDTIIGGRAHTAGGEIRSANL
jgi:hypothetical protein